MLPSDKCEDDCVPAGFHHSRSIRTGSATTISISTIPFVITFILVSIIALQKLFPVVASLQAEKDEEQEHYLPSDAPPSLRQKHAEHNAKSGRRRVVAITFSTTIALAAVLVELILCELSNTLNPAARGLALQIVVPTLLFSLVVLIPFLELQSIVSGSGWSFKRENGRIPRTTWMLQTCGFTLWLMAFWWLGKGVPGTYIHTMASQAGKDLSEACLERVGIIGISLMALLSGFAAVSAPYQMFGAKQKPVTEADVTRKLAGLDATNDMLAAKRSRLRALQRKILDAPAEGFMTKVMGTIRGSADTQEIKALELEITGLESMSVSLSSSLSLLQNRLASTQRASSPVGKIFLTPFAYAFAIYCVYRIFTVSLTILRQALFPNPDAVFTSSTTDPINRILSLLAKHVDPTLDQLAWSRQISFLLSGIILLASFNSVVQTFHMLTKLLPSLLYQAQANLALIVAQVSATYVISSALLLRSNLPIEMKSVVSEALGSPLEPGFVERWFDGWFLVASLCTMVGIFVWKKVSGPGDWDDWDIEADPELGQKRS